MATWLSSLLLRLIWCSELRHFTLDLLLIACALALKPTVYTVIVKYLRIARIAGDYRPACVGHDLVKVMRLPRSLFACLFFVA